MHTVGIKRVFWTNNNGEWEGAKVRDLMDTLDLVGTSSSEVNDNDAVTGGAAGTGCS